MFVFRSAAIGDGRVSGRAPDGKLAHDEADLAGVDELLLHAREHVLLEIGAMRTGERDIFDHGDGRVSLAERAFSERPRRHQLGLGRNVGRLVDRGRWSAGPAAASRKRKRRRKGNRRLGRADAHHCTYWPEGASASPGACPSAPAAAGFAAPESEASNAATVCSPVSRLPLTKKEGVESTPKVSCPRVRVSRIFSNSALSPMHWSNFSLVKPACLAICNSFSVPSPPSATPCSCVSTRAPTSG